MSNFLAVATATAALKFLIQRAIDTQPPGGVLGAKVTTLPPHDADFGPESPGVNIFLYQSAPNASLRSIDLPTRDAKGGLLQKPRAPINLSYLLTFHGDFAQLEAQRLMGMVTSTLHATPQLDRDVIEQGMKDYPFLKTSDLADQVELVKFSPIDLTLDELSKFWSVFFRVEYRLSAAYLASVILLDGPGTPQQTLPVREPRLALGVFEETFIASVSVKDHPEEPITAASVLSIKGRRLSGPSLEVTIDGNGVDPDSTSAYEVVVTLDPETMPWLRSGVATAHIRHRSDTKGSRLTVESNPFPVTVHPEIKSLAGAPGTPPELTVTVSPDLVEGQRVMLYLNPFQGQAERGFVFGPERIAKPAAGATKTNVVSFPLPEVPPQTTYLARVGVDGSRSPLLVDEDPASPFFGAYVEPRVTIP